MNPSEAHIAARLRERYDPEIFLSVRGYADRPPRHDGRYRRAAVLIPLAAFRGEWLLLYTRRTDTLENHKGQVSFPGGQCDESDDSMETTALREAEEEMGIRPSDVRVLGRVNDVATITGFRVTPVVGVIPFPYAFRVSTVEVGRVFTIPMKWLANRNHYWEFLHPEAKYRLVAYQPYDGELLWGATARMTLEFLRTIEML
jgi:8-oxo-dGTP pyrophosphatase MutT (NUDIX family)